MQPTSKIAQAKSAEFKAKHQEKIILALMGMPDGGTFDEIAKASGLTYNAVGRRCHELVRDNKVTATGTYGLSPTGNKAMKWKLTGTQTKLFQ